MLLNDFFEIIEIHNTSVKVISKIKLNLTHKIFLGHFPNNPITPGVVLIQIVKEILENCCNKELQLIKMSRCKFLKILNPNETPIVIVHINISVIENIIKADAFGRENENIFFKLSAVYQ